MDPGTTLPCRPNLTSTNEHDRSSILLVLYIAPRCLTTRRIDNSHPIEIEGEVALLVRTRCRGGMKDVYDDRRPHSLRISERARLRWQPVTRGTYLVNSWHREYTPISHTSSTSTAASSIPYHFIAMNLERIGFLAIALYHLIHLVNTTSNRPKTWDCRCTTHYISPVFRHSSSAPV